MDFKTHILSWEYSIQENPAILALAIIAALTVAFISTILIDGYLKARQQKNRKSAKTRH